MTRRASRCSGYDIAFIKTVLLVIACLMAGFAGSLYTTVGFVSPTLLGVFFSTQVLVWVGIGGRGTLVGPILGTVLVGVLETVLSGQYKDIWPLFVGLTFLAVVLFWPRGLYPLVLELGARASSEAALGPARHEDPTTGDAAIDGHGLHKHFGGVAALDDFSITVGEREIRCVVGPNGAGKSTLFKVLAGLERPIGDVAHPGATTRPGCHARDVARLGVATKLQTPRIFPSLTVREHLGLAARAGQRRPPAARPRSTTGDRRGRRAGGRAARWTSGLAAAQDRIADELSHGESQWLEIVMMLSTRPKILLLDEPGAGMAQEEKVRTATLLRRLAET